MDALPIPTSILNNSSLLKKYLGKIPKTKGQLTVLAGEKKDLFFINLTEVGHLFLTGWVQSSKEQVIRTILTSLVFNYGPSEVRFIVYDDEADFEDLTLINPYSLTPIIHDEAIYMRALRWTINELQERHRQFIASGVSTIEDYNTQFQKEYRGKIKTVIERTIPHIIFIIKTIDSLSHEHKSMINELVNKGSKVGIHLILVSHSIFKHSLSAASLSNLPNRIICPITNDEEGLEIGIPDAKHLKDNEMFILCHGEKPIKINRIDVSKEDVTKIHEYIKKEYTAIHYSEEFIETPKTDNHTDSLFTEALQIVIESGKASTSFIQRKLKIGYSRAAALIDMMEEQGYVGSKGNGEPRELLKK